MMPAQYIVYDYVRTGYAACLEKRSIRQSVNDT